MNNDNNINEEVDTLFGNGHLIGQANLSLHFSQVSYVCKKSKIKTLILENVNGQFQAGRLTAIMGPSGAGKTSLLNVLSGFRASGVCGQFLVNNEKRDLLSFRKISSYIPQDFAMLDLLTVQETLRVSTDLKLTTTSNEKEQIITDILRILNMEQCRHSLVCNLSGGEKKRLSIGIELVSNPPVMFFDEPTSGLDSFASLQLISYLKRLACDGRIVVCVVHQPSSRLMQFFDDIFVLSRGRMLYAGPQCDMIGQFEKAGYKCPNFYNPADFVLEVASEEHESRILKLIDQNQKNEGDISTKAESGQPNGASIHISSDDNNVRIVQMQNQTQIRLRPKERVSFSRQFSVLFCRSLRSMSRNLISVQLRIIMHIIVGVLLGIVFWNIGDDASKVLTNSSCILFIILFVFFGNAMPSILLCPQDTAVFLREYLNGWYSTWSYYAAKTVADLPMQFICPTLFIIIVYFMTSQPMDLGRLAMCWGVCFLTAFIGHFMGLVFGSTFDLQMSVFLVPSITIPFLIFSGFFIRIHELSSVLRPLCDISFFRYTMEGFVQAIYGYERPDLNCYEEFCYYKSPKKFLEDLDMNGNRYGVDIMALFMCIAVLKVLFYMSLVYRVKKIQ